MVYNQICQEDRAKSFGGRMMKQPTKEMLELPVMWTKENNIDYEEHGISDGEEYYEDIITIMVDQITLYNPHPNPKWTVIRFNNGDSITAGVNYKTFQRTLTNIKIHG